MYKCEHLKQDSTKRGHRIHIRGWIATVCDECHQTVKETAEEMSYLFHQHGTLKGDRNV